MKRHKSSLKANKQGSTGSKKSQGQSNQSHLSALECFAQVPSVYSVLKYILSIRLYSC